MRFKYYYRGETYNTPWDLAMEVVEQDRERVIEAINHYTTYFPNGNDEFDSVEEDISNLDLTRNLIAGLCLDEYRMTVYFSTNVGAEPKIY